MKPRITLKKIAKEFGVLSIPDFDPKVSGANPPIFYHSGDTTNVITNEENLQFFDSLFQKFFQCIYLIYKNVT